MAEENKPDEELLVTPQEDGSVVIGDDAPHDDDDEADERLSSTEQHDEQGHSEETDAEREERTERNRQRRRESKDKRKEFVESLKRQVESERAARTQLEQRLSVIERKSSGSEMAQLDRAEQEAINAYNQFKDINAKAIEQANGTVAIEAQERMFEARQKVIQLREIKTAMGRKQNAPAPLDPRLVTHADKWMKANDWYDPSGKDQDSAVTLTVDNRLAAEGWDPTTPEYWDELSVRIKKYLPHRAKMGYNTGSDAGRRNPPPVSGSGRESSGSGSTSYKLSADRVSALKESGMWDDPKQRAEAIKRYQAYDKEQRA
jgi:hypothetical protein